MMANVLLGIHCVVPGCMSTQRRVNQWKAKNCQKPKHKGKTHAQCMCPEPYQFFKFPTEVKLQKLWLERVRRPDLEVNNLTRVCSMHFIEGKPTRRHYFPNMNLHQDQDEEDEADNEMEDPEYLDEDREARDDLHMQQKDAVKSPPLAKKSRSGGSGGTVSIVPMELLQEPAGNNEEQQGEEEEEYEEGLTISRFNQGRDGGAYELPTNSVTITRVNTAPPVVTTCTKPSNRFINTSKPRIESGATGNRFLRDRAAPANSSVGLARNRVQPTAIAPTTSQTRPPATLTSPKKNLPLRMAGNPVARVTKPQHLTTPPIKIQQQQQQQQTQRSKQGKETSPSYDMEDEDDGDSSELSDIGIDIQPTGSLKQQYTSKDMSTARTLSSLVLSRHHTPTATSNSAASTQKDAASVTKPKLIPILAVAPKSQHGTVFQPVQTVTRPGNLIPAQQIRKIAPNPNTIVSATAAPKPVVTATTSGSSSGVPIVGKTVIAVAGSTCAVKTEPSSGTPVITSTSSLSTVNAAAGQQKPAPTSANAPAAPTLATYDPTKQQLQIANPVKYIQECHTRIATLLAEKQNLESRTAELEAKVQELQKSNNDLRREIVHQALNAARRTPQQMNTPTFNLIPTAIMNANQSTPTPTESQNGNNSSDSGSNGGNKPRIRYVIRRPTANMPSGTSSAK